MLCGRSGLGNTKHHVSRRRIHTYQNLHSIIVVIMHLSMSSPTPSLEHSGDLTNLGVNVLSIEAKYLVNSPLNPHPYPPTYMGFDINVPRGGTIGAVKSPIKPCQSTREGVGLDIDRCTTPQYHVFIPVSYTTIYYTYHTLTLYSVSFLMMVISSS